MYFIQIREDTEAKKEKMNNTVLAGTFEVEGPGADGHGERGAALRTT